MRIRLAALASFLLCTTGAPWLAPSLQVAPPKASAAPAAPTMPGKGSSVPLVQPTVVQTVPLPGEPDRAIQIEIGPCRKPDDCPYQASLVSGKAVIATRQFDWVSASPLPERTSDTSRWGSGDLIAPQPLEGWSSGEEQRFVGVTWSSTVITDLPDGRQGLVFFHGADIAADGNEMPDELGVQVLIWNDKKQRLVPHPRQGRAFAIVVGPFPTVQAATALRKSQGACVGASSIRPAKSFLPAGARGFVLVRLTSSAVAATSTRATTQTCLPKLRATVVALK